MKVKPEYAGKRYLKVGDKDLLEKLKNEKNTNGLQDNSHQEPSKVLTKTIEINDDIYQLVEDLRKQRGYLTLSDAITELHNSYPWHVLACDIDQKRLFDDGLVISTKEELADALDKERARYFVVGFKKTPLEQLPQGVRDHINVKQ